jgi:hypothetical protein
MFRRQPRAIFRGVFKPNFLLSWPSVRYVVLTEHTTYLTEGQLNKKFRLKTPLKMARGWRRNMSGEF